MPSSLTAGPALRARLKSRLVSGLVGYASPEFPIVLDHPTAPGAVGSWAYPVARACKLVRVDQVNEIAGAGASKIFLRRHVAGQTAAANAATSGTVITEIITNGLAADAAVRVPVLNAPFVAANATFAAGDKLALITPLTWAGNITLYLVWL